MRHPLLATAALALPLAVTAQPVVLADGRDQQVAADVSGWAARPAVRQAMDASRANWRARDASYEEDARVVAVAPGSFTAPGTRQEAVLYLMSLWPRCCPKMGLAIVEGDRLVSNWAFEGTEQTLSAVGDVNGDGMDELVFTGEFGMGGQVSRSMTLTTFGPAGPEDMGGTSIMESACAAGAGGGTSSAWLINADGPAISSEQFTQSCNGGPWVSAGPAATLHLEPVGEPRYMPLAAGGAPAPPAGGVRVERGRLEAGDETLNTGEYSDEYAVQCRAGRLLVVDLRSTEMDPYLIVRPPGATQIDNDDHEGDVTHSRVETTPPQDGTCDVLVTSFQPGETGAYELTIEGGE